jgi:hypothetical protein
MNKKNRSTSGFVDSSSILSVVVALMVLSVGAFAFYSTIQAFSENNTQNKTTAQTTTSSEVFNMLANIIPISLVILGISGIVYYVARAFTSHEIDTGYWEETDEKPKKEKSVPIIADQKNVTPEPKLLDLKTKLEQRKKQLKRQQEQIEKDRKKEYND